MSETFATAEVEADSSVPAPAPEPAPAIKPGKEPIGGQAPEIHNQPTGEQPEYIPDKFWNPDLKTANVEELAKSYIELEQSYNTKTEALKTDIERRFHESRLSQRPDSADDYVAQPPDGFLPKEAVFTADEDNPMMKFWRQSAYSMGLGQTEFENGIAAFIDNMMHEAPDTDKAIESLGQNGKDRFEAVQTWLHGKLGEDSIEHFGPMLGTAAGIMDLEKVIAMTKDFQQGGSASFTSAKPRHTRESLEALMKTPGYADPHRRDPAIVKEVQDGWRQLIPDPEEQLQARNS